MANPFDAIVAKYAKKTEPAVASPGLTLPEGAFGASKPAPVPVTDAVPKLAPLATPPELAGNPYAAVVSKYQTAKLQSGLDKNMAFADKAIEGTQNPGIFREIANTIKQIPGAAGSVISEAVHHPVQSAQSVVLGAMDVGPAILNFLSSVGSKATNAIYGQGATTPEYIPLPGEAFNDYVGRNDTQRSITEGSKQGASFEIGNKVVEGVFPKIFSYSESAAGDVAGGSMIAKTPTSLLGRMGTNAAGNVIGGQLIAPSDTSFKDRAKQAAFDAAFGAAQTLAGAGFRALRGTKSSELPKVEETAPPTETPPPPNAGQTIGRKISKVTPPEPPHVSDVVYVKKSNLGVDTKGEKVLATTEYNSKNGKAIIYYTGSLDKDPVLRQTVLDHEIGHVVDKRVNAGRNLSSEIQNPTGNESTLRNTMGPFARQTGQTLEQAATKLAADIENLSKGKGSNPGEKFANAYAAYRADPAASAAEAPTFDAFMKHSPVLREPVIQTRTLTEKGLKSTGRTYPEPISAKTAKLEQKQTAEPEPKLTPKAKAAVEPKPSVARSTPIKLNKIGADMIAKAKKEGKPIVIDPDEFKKATGDFDPKNHEIYSDAAKRLFARALKENKDPATIFTAGGSGSGKSEILLRSFEKEKFKGIVYDGTMRDYGSTIKKIEQAVASGKRVEIRGVVTDVERAWNFTKSRGDKTGRYVPKDFFIDAHSGYVETLKRLIQEGYDVQIRDTRGINSATEARNTAFITDPQKVLDILDEVGYTKNELQSKLYDKTEHQTDTSRPQSDGQKSVSGTNEKAKPNSAFPGRREKHNGISQGGRTDKKLVRTAPPKHTETPKPGTGRIASTGLRTGKGVNTKSFNPKSFNAPTDVEELFNTLGADNKNFSSQRLSKGNEDIKDLARMTGLTEDELIKASPGSIANSETATAARQLVLNKAEDLMNTLKSIDVSTASKADLQRIKDDFIKLVSMQKAVSGFRTEASNVFRSFGIELAPGENATLSELAALLKQEGLASEGDAAVFAGKVAKQTKLSNFEKIREGALATWYAAILSGPKTTVRNILSTGSNILTEIAAKTVNPKQWKEVIPSITGLVRGLQMGLPEAREVLRGGSAPTKFMETGRNATEPAIFTGKAATYGTIIESVGRFLNAQDKLLSAGVREMERASLKARGLQVSSAVEEAVTRAYAERTVYHGHPTGKLIGSLRDAAHALRKKYPASKFVVPFVDTVANVMDRQFDYIPITAALRLKSSVISEQATRIMKDYDLKEGDRAFIEQRIRDQQIGRLALGTTISTGAFLLASGGRVSGNGPTNYSEKQQLMRTGWRPNSIKIGDTWVPYTYLGPLAGILSMAGNVHDKIEYDNAKGKDLTSLIGNGLVGWTQTQLNQSFLSGVADIFDVATGGVTPKSYLDRFLTGLVPIPAAYSQTKDMIFRQQYQTQGIIDSLRVKLGLTEGLQPRLDQFGEPMTSDLIFGISPSAENASKVDRFLISNDLVVSIPSRTQEYSLPGPGKEKASLTPEQYTEYVERSGKQIYQELDRRVAELSSLSADKQKTTVQNLVDRIRTQVRTQILRQTKK